MVTIAAPPPGVRFIALKDSWPLKNATQGCVPKSQTEGARSQKRVSVAITIPQMYRKYTLVWRFLGRVTNKEFARK